MIHGRREATSGRGCHEGSRQQGSVSGSFGAGAVAAMIVHKYKDKTKYSGAGAHGKWAWDTLVDRRDNRGPNGRAAEYHYGD